MMVESFLTIVRFLPPMFDAVLPLPDSWMSVGLKFVIPNSFAMSLRKSFAMSLAFDPWCIVPCSVVAYCDPWK